MKSNFQMPGLRANYIILSTPRTGSTILSASLKASGVAGVPEEFFHKRRLKLAGNPERTEAGLQRYLLDVISRNTTSNGVFGLKLHFSQFANLFNEKMYGISNGLGFLSRFDKFILIYRQDKIMQAISELLAEEVGFWNTEKADNNILLGRLLRKQDVPRILRIMARQIQEENEWRNLLNQTKRKFYELSYERLVSETESAFAEVSHYLDIPELGKSHLQTRTYKITDVQITNSMKVDFLNAIGAMISL